MIKTWEQMLIIPADALFSVMAKLLKFHLFLDIDS